MPTGLQQLARAPVTTMSPSLDPSQMSQDAILATLWTSVQALRAEVAEVKDTQKWIFRVAVGCLATAAGGLFTALLHLAGAYLTMSQHMKP